MNQAPPVPTIMKVAPPAVYSMESSWNNFLLDILYKKDTIFIILYFIKG